MKKLVPLSAVILAVALANDATAQKDRAAGMGKVEAGPNDVNTPTNLGFPGATGNQGALGIVELNGEYFVSARGTTNPADGSWASAPPHTCYVYDKSGNLLRNFDEGAASAGTTWGWRDGATDGQSLMFGYDNGIEVVDTNGNPVNTVMAANGPQAIVNPIAGPGLAALAVYRAVAYDPSGNGGNGAIFSANFGSDIYQVDLAGNILQQYPAAGWSLYGLAIDPITGNLWGHTTGSEIIEIDLPSGTPTGVSITSVANAGAAQGGLSGIQVNQLDRRTGFDLAALAQATPDEFSQYRVHLHNGVIGYLEAELVGGKNGGALSNNATVDYALTDASVELGNDITADPTKAGRPILYGINFGADALPNAKNFFFHEMVLVVPFSIPAGNLILFAPDALGNPALSFPPPDIGVGNKFRVQGLYAEPFSPTSGVMATNQIRYCQTPPKLGVTVIAEGTNSFNSDPTFGFFSVQNNSADPITEVTFDWVASSNPAQSTMVFDTDQTGMADVFEGGNGGMAGCLGTYRNGSDVATGLIYDALNTVPATPCDPTANTGWIGATATVVDSWRTLTFRYAGGAFMGGAKFEFDADTDGGAGINGAAMAGMVVTVKTMGGATLSGELAAVGATKSQLDL